jgi:hypothetical protein
MGKIYQSIDDTVRSFIAAQKMFFVASAPLSAEGHVNVSPKGFDAFRILDPNTIAYLDLFGSGIETIAHVRENRRITIMFAAFDGPPKIMRLYGQGFVFEPGEPGFDDLAGLFPKLPGIRSVIKVDISRITDSCGWGVPVFDFVQDRETYAKAIAGMSPQKLAAAVDASNRASIDGLPGLKA